MSKMRYRTLRENVADEIKGKILNRELKPGMRIIEQNLSDELEVSRGPIREALRQLEQEGFVEYKRNAGCSIKEVSTRDLYEIYLLRSTYETLSVRLCNGCYTEDDIQKMEHILEQMKDIEDYQKVIECDQKFHQILVKKAGFQRIEKVWSDLDYFNIVSSYLVGFEEKAAIKRQYKIHRILIDACRTNDEDVICKAIYDHYMKSLEQFMKKEDIKCIHK
mgnify:CR=1 FL=1